MQVGVLCPALDRPRRAVHEEADVGLREPGSPEDRRRDGDGSRGRAGCPGRVRGGQCERERGDESAGAHRESLLLESWRNRITNYDAFRPAGLRLEIRCRGERNGERRQASVRVGARGSARGRFRPGARAARPRPAPPAGRRRRRPTSGGSCGTTSSPGTPRRAGGSTGGCSAGSSTRPSATGTRTSSRARATASWAGSCRPSRRTGGPRPGSATSPSPTSIGRSARWAPRAAGCSSSRGRSEPSAASRS